MTPTLTDYITGNAIRPATREEWQRSKDAVISEPGGTGAFTLDGRLVFVAGDFPAPAPTAHTPEPWAVGYGAAYTAGPGGEVGDESIRLLLADRDTTKTRPTERDANIRRAVACVNACAGIADPGATLAEVRALLRAIIHNPGNRYGVENYAELALALLGAK